MWDRLIPGISRSARQSFLAMIALAGLTFVCFRLQLNISTAGFLYLIVIVLLSLAGDCIASVVTSVVAAMCLAYFFAPPIFSIRVDDPLNIVAIIAFLTTSLVISRLVSEVRTRSDKLRLNENYLSHAQRLAHMGCWAFDTTGFSYWSSELFRVHGLDPRGKPPTVEEYLALVHPEDCAFMKRSIAKMLDDHLAFDFTKRIVRPDGEIRHVRSVGVPVTQAGLFQGFLGTEMDVTEQEQLTEELRRNGKELRDVIDTIPAIVWSALPDGFNTYINMRFVEYSGLSAEQTAGSGWQTAIHPDDLERSVGKWIEVVATGKPLENEVRFRRSDGQYRWHLDRGVPLRDEAGNIVKWYGVVTDIEDRKRAEEALRLSEQRFRLIVDNIPGLVCTMSATGEVQLVSRQVLEYFRKSPEELKSWATSDAVHPDDLPRVISAWASSIETGHPYEIEHRCRRGDGVYRWFQVRALPMRDDEGRITGWYNLLADIDDRKRAEEARDRLRHLEAELAHINCVSTLGEMAASLAHEIKQPIAAAITSANCCIEWLAHEPPNLDRARAAAVRSDKHGNRAAEIIDRIRSFYKKSPPQRELVDANGVIHEMLTLLKGEATPSSITMRMDLSAELPQIMVDRVQLQQVFMNLMLNGIEAMQDSGGDLTVKSELQDGQLQFSVSDTGVGLPPEAMDQIFSAFFTTKPQGSGMGLAISRSIVESHGGQLWASANRGAGATFHFTLPIQVTESSPLVA